MARISVAEGMTDALAQPGEPGYVEPEEAAGPAEAAEVAPEPEPPPAPKAARAAPSLTDKKAADEL